MVYTYPCALQRQLRRRRGEPIVPPRGVRAGPRGPRRTRLPVREPRERAPGPIGLWPPRRRPRAGPRRDHGAGGGIVRSARPLLPSRPRDHPPLARLGAEPRPRRRAVPGTGSSRSITLRRSGTKPRAPWPTPRCPTSWTTRAGPPSSLPRTRSTTSRGRSSSPGRSSPTRPCCISPGRDSGRSSSRRPTRTRPPTGRPRSGSSGPPRARTSSVVSYATDPAYALANGEAGTLNSTVSWWNGTAYGWQSIYGVGVVQGSRQVALARAPGGLGPERHVPVVPPRERVGVPRQRECAASPVFSAAIDPRRRWSH